MRRDAQGVDEALARLCVVHRTIGNAAANTVLNSAAELLPVRSADNGVDDALIVTELFGKKRPPNSRRRPRLNPQRFEFVIEHGAFGGTQA